MGILFSSSFKQHHSVYSTPVTSKWSVSGGDNGVVKEYERQEKRPSSWLVASELPDGRIVAGSILGDVSSWPPAADGSATSVRSRRWEPAHSAVINCICVLPDGNRIASASSDGTVIVRDTQNYGMIKKLEKHKGYKVHWLTLVPATNKRKKWWMACTSSDKTTSVWDTDTWELVGTCSGHQKAVYASEWIKTVDEAETYGMVPERQQPGSPQSQTDNKGRRVLLTGDTRGVVYWWSLPDCKIIHKADLHSTWVTAALCLPYSNRAVTVDANGQMIIWDATTMNRIMEPTHNCGRFTSLALIDAENSLFISSSWGKNIAIWDGTTGECLHVHWLSVPSSNVRVASVRRSGDHIEAHVIGGFLTIYPILKWKINLQRVKDSERTSKRYITQSSESDVEWDESGAPHNSWVTRKLLPAAAVVGITAGIAFAYYQKRRRA